jgi:hypothetical protein
MNTTPSLTWNVYTSPSEAEIALTLAMLNASLAAPDLRADEPINVDMTRHRAMIADACFQWFLGHRIPLERDQDHRYSIFVACQN